MTLKKYFIEIRKERDYYKEKCQFLFEELIRIHKQVKKLKKNLGIEK